MTEIMREMGIRVKLDGIPATIEKSEAFYKAVDLKLWKHEYPHARIFLPVVRNSCIEEVQ